MRPVEGDPRSLRRLRGLRANGARRTILTEGLPLGLVLGVPLGAITYMLAPSDVGTAHRLLAVLVVGGTGLFAGLLCAAVQWWASMRQLRRLEGGPGPDLGEVFD